MRDPSPPQPAPHLLAHGGRFDAASGVLHCTHNSGFFSVCTVAIWNLAEVFKATGTWPTKIDFSRAFSAYKTPSQASHQTDMGPVFFQPPPGDGAKLPDRLPELNHHGLYKLIDFERITPVVEHYFRPGDASRALQQQLIERHGIDLQRTIAVAYRGTDKSTEVKVAAPQAYLAQARRLLDRHPGFRVLIQTDEGAVRDLFCRELGDRCFYLPEVPVSGAVDPSDGDEEQRRRRHLDPCEFGVMVVAVWHLLSCAAFIVNHTGNMALWICLWRGHAQGLVQFDDEGGLVDFSDPRFYARRCRGVLKKAALRLGWTRAGQG